MQTFATTAPISTVLDVPAGNIGFIAADRVDTTVEVLPSDASKGRDVKAAEQTTVEFSDGVLRVETLPGKNRILGNPGSIEVTIQLPAGSSIEAKAASARVRGVGRLGEVTVDAAQGPVKLDEAASAHLALQDGDITVGRLTGSAEISTLKGDINVAEATGGTLVLRTEMGDVSVGAAAGISSSLDAGTTLGRVRNALKNTGGPADLTIHATTALGDVAAHSL